MSCGVTILSILADGRCEAKTVSLLVSLVNVSGMDAVARKMHNANNVVGERKVVAMSLQGKGKCHLKLIRPTMLILANAPNWATGSGLFQDNVADGVGDSVFLGTKLPTTAAQQQCTDRLCL